MGMYKVKAGDTLYAIARLFGITWRELYNHPNNVRFRAKRPDPDRIFPGDVLWVPDVEDDDPGDKGGEGSGAEKTKPGPSRPEDEEDRMLCPTVFHDTSNLYPYKVQDGDTLKNIAERLGITWQELAQLNWCTEDPVEINWYLENYFVCKKKVGANYVFTSEDDPGLLLLPRELSPPVPKLQQVVLASRWQPQ